MAKIAIVSNTKIRVTQRPLCRYIPHMTKARIYQPNKNAMQSGKAKAFWVVEFAPGAPGTPDELMGWNSMTDTLQELNLRFPSQEAAVAYVERQCIAYEIEAPTPSAQVKKAYADNFSFKKVSS